MTLWSLKSRFVLGQLKLNNRLAQGSRKLRMTAKETMTAAEKLYTAGLISYPRSCFHSRYNPKRGLHDEIKCSKEFGLQD